MYTIFALCYAIIVIRHAFVVEMVHLYRCCRRIILRTRIFSKIGPNCAPLLPLAAHPVSAVFLIFLFVVFYLFIGCFYHLPTASESNSVTTSASTATSTTAGSAEMSPGARGGFTIKGLKGTVEARLGRTSASPTAISAEPKV